MLINLKKKYCFFKIGAFALVLCSCATTEIQTSEKSSFYSFSHIKNILDQHPQIAELKNDGPFHQHKITNYHISLSPKEFLLADIYKPDSLGKKPLIILVHGNKSSKEAHAMQGEYFASWGLIAMAISLPNLGEWMENGERILKLVKLIKTLPTIISSDVDPDNIILAGHSFGGSAVSIASGLNAPVKGLILLDPALYKSEVIRYIEKNNKPTILLGADRDVFKSRKRSAFFKYKHNNIGEISIRNSHHDDAQMPSMTEFQNVLGLDFNVDYERQKTFAASMLVSSLSLIEDQSPESAIKVFLNDNNQKFYQNPRIKK